MKIKKERRSHFPLRDANGALKLSATFSCKSAFNLSPCGYLSSLYNKIHQFNLLTYTLQKK